jgi:hypothetical protein
VKNWESIVGMSKDKLNCYTEFCHAEGATLRAHPDYQAGAHFTKGQWSNLLMMRMKRRITLHAVSFFSQDFKGNRRRK